MFYFAWVEANETTFEPAHERVDADIFSFEVNHAETEFPTLKVTIVNPRVGLLSAARKQWAWFAWKPEEGPTVPLFFGRLVGIPEGVQADTVTLTFLARPADYDERKHTLAESLKVAPYWDPVWVRPQALQDPDVVLDARTQAYHIDRVTHAVTVSDIITGEDGVVEVAGDNVYRDTLSVGFGPVPGSRIDVEGAITWNQKAVGDVDITKALVDAFAAAGTSRPGMITSFTGEGLQDDWPKRGDRIGGGWEFGDSTVERVDGVSQAQTYRRVIASNGSSVYFPLWTFKPVLHVRYDVERSKSETVRFSLSADVQPIVNDPGGEDIISLSLQSAELSELVARQSADAETGETLDTENATGLTPDQIIFNLNQRSFIQSERGWDAIANLIMRARARLIARARAVDISLEIPWDVGIGLTCRKNLRVVDPSLPGGEAVGKVVAYRLAMDGDSGQRVASVQIGCTVGRGATLTASEGTPVYVEDGYMEDVQAREGRLVMPVAGEVTFSPPEGETINDDGVDFHRMTADSIIVPTEGSVVEPGLVVEFGETEQRAIINNPVYDGTDAINALARAYTSVRLNLRPLTRGPFEQVYDIEVSDLKIPQTINLGDEEATETETA